MWTVIYSREFLTWIDSLNEDESDSVFAMMEILKSQGPQLPRPYADVIHGSRISNLKELRIQHQGRPLRAFFAFDPLRQAVVLCAGDKTGDKRFYERMVPVAEKIWFEYLKELPS